MKTRELNLPDCKSCCGSGEQIDSSKINSKSIDIPWKICVNCGGSGVDPKYDPDEPKVYFSTCCGTEIKDPIHFDYQICPDCHCHTSFEEVEE